MTRKREVRPKKPRAPIIDDTAMKQDLYDAIDEAIFQHRGGIRLGRAFAKQLFDMQMDLIFRYALHSGMFRFPRGLGTLRLRQLAPTSKRLPGGEVLEIPVTRTILKYYEGLAVRAALGKPDKYPGRKNPVRASLTERPW